MALAQKFSTAAAEGKVLAPAKSIEEMQRVAFNNYLDAVVCGFFVLLVLAMCVYTIKICRQALAAGATDRAGNSADGTAGSDGMTAQTLAPPRNGLLARVRNVRAGVPAGVRHPGLRGVPRARGGATSRHAGAVAPRFLRAGHRSKVRQKRPTLLLAGHGGEANASNGPRLANVCFWQREDRTVAAADGNVVR